MVNMLTKSCLFTINRRKEVDIANITHWFMAFLGKFSVGWLTGASSFAVLSAHK